jgi:hypothetical protein
VLCYPTRKEVREKQKRGIKGCRIFVFFLVAVNDVAVAMKEGGLLFFFYWESL